MGLDTYATRPDEGLTEEDLEAFEQAELELCGGLFSGGGGSFRGKVYADVVSHVTGVSLYQQSIPPETVERMAEAFERCDPERVAAELAGSWYQPSVHEVIELRRFFTLCAERGLGLVGWW